MTIAVLVVVLALVATDHVEIVPPLDVAVGPGRRIREVPLRRARAPPFPEASTISPQCPLAAGGHMQRMNTLAPGAAQ